MSLKSNSNEKTTTTIVRKDLLLDTGEYLFAAIKENDDKWTLYRAPCPVDYPEKFSPKDWEQVRVANREEKKKIILLKRVDDFFGSNFSPTHEHSNLIYRTDTHYYRVHSTESVKILQRCVAPTIFYGNKDIPTSNITWKDVHNGQRFLIDIDQKLLLKINQFFKTNFQTKTANDTLIQL